MEMQEMVLFASLFIFGFIFVGLHAMGVRLEVSSFYFDSSVLLP